MLFRTFSLVSILAVILNVTVAQRADGASPATSPTPSASPTEAFDRRLFLKLELSTPKPEPPSILPFAPAVKPTGKAAPYIIFVIGQGEPATTGKLITALTERLQTLKLFSHPDTWVIPEPTWKIDDFVAYCKKDREHTLGAFIASLDATATSSINRVYSHTASAEINAHVLYAQCFLWQPAATTTPAAGSTPEPERTPAAAFVWFSRSVIGFGKVTTVTPLSPLAILLGVGSLVSSFIPAKSTSTLTTTSFPTPGPTATSAITSIATTTGANFNPSGAGSLAASLLTGFTAISASQVQVPTVDVQAWWAVADAMNHVADSTYCDPNPLVKKAYPLPTFPLPTERDEKWIKSHGPISSFGYAKAPFCYGYVGTGPSFTPTPAPSPTP